MLAAGISWGVYSLLGRGAGDPTEVTAGNFLRATLLAVALSLLRLQPVALDFAGVILAVTSGALASGLGYAIWYRALRGLRATEAATVQLSVPVLAAAGSVLWLHEPLTGRLVAAAVAILGGVAAVIAARSLVGRDR